MNYKGYEIQIKPNPKNKEYPSGKDTKKFLVSKNILLTNYII